MRERRQALNSLSYVFREAGYEGRYEPQKIRAGWTKERLMAYYVLSEREYERIMECLKGIRQGVRI